MGLRPGDRVGEYMPNITETPLAMLATASIGLPAVLDRLGQIQARVLFTVDEYFYKGKEIETLPGAG